MLLGTLFDTPFIPWGRTVCMLVLRVVMLWVVMGRLFALGLLRMWPRSSAVAWLFMDLLPVACFLGYWPVLARFVGMCTACVMWVAA